MSATGFTGTLNNAYVITQPNTGGPTGGNWMEWTVHANTVKAMGPTGGTGTVMGFNVGGTGYATLSASGFILTNPPANGDSSNKVATTAWVMSNAPGGSGGATLSGNNTFIGTNTFNNNNLTVNGVSVGKGAGSGANNTAMGTSALNANTSGANNTAMGTSALTVNTANQNTAVGSLALQANTSGTPNTAVGYNALSANISGTNNVAVGDNALKVNTANQNTAVGSLALQANIGGTPNTAVGYNALSANTTGTNNIAVGASAGGVVTTGTNNIYIGNSTNASAATGVTGEVVIGNGITGAGSNTVAIGSGGSTFATLSSAGLVLTTPPPAADSSNKVATTSWVNSNVSYFVWHFNWNTAQSVNTIIGSSGLVGSIMNTNIAGTFINTPSSGRLTVPVTGVYICTFDCAANSNNFNTVLLRINGTYYNPYENAAGSYVQITFTEILYLTAGAVIDFFCNNGGTQTTFVLALGQGSGKGINFSLIQAIK